MTEGAWPLREAYLAYIDCLNRRDWERLGEHVAETVWRNGERLGLPGYRQMLEDDVRAIPDLAFRIEHLVCEGDRVAARLVFDCAPVGDLLGLPVNGRRVRFFENVFYRYEGGRIVEVLSVLDKLALESALRS